MLYISTIVWVLSTLNPGWKFLLPYLQKLCKILTQEWRKMRQKEPIFALNKIAGWHKNAGLAPQETGKIMLSDKKSTTTGKNICAFLLHFLLKGVKPFSFLGCQCFCVAQHLGIRQKRNFCITFASETCKNLKKMKIWSSVWSGKHPNAGQNIQPIQILCFDTLVLQLIRKWSYIFGIFRTPSQ